MVSQVSDFIRNWRTRQQRYSLIGEVCADCGTKIFPPRDICPECKEQNSNEEGSSQVQIGVKIGKERQ